MAFEPATSGRAPLSDITADTVERYRRTARRYDALTRVLGRYRREAVERLALRAGETVVDVACGTGANLHALTRAVGPTGRVIAIDLSADMLGIAHARAEEAGWGNVELINAPAPRIPRCRLRHRCGRSRRPASGPRRRCST